MRKPFFALAAIAASFVVVGIGGGQVAADGSPPDNATWRWTVTALLDAQHASEAAQGSSAAATDFRQHYDRFSVTGQPEPAR